MLSIAPPFAVRARGGGSPPCRTDGAQPSPGPSAEHPLPRGATKPPRSPTPPSPLPPAPPLPPGPQPPPPPPFPCPSRRPPCSSSPPPGAAALPPPPAPPPPPVPTLSWKGFWPAFGGSGIFNAIAPGSRTPVGCSGSRTGTNGFAPCTGFSALFFEATPPLGLSAMGSSDAAYVYTVPTKSRRGGAAMAGAGASDAPAGGGAPASRGNSERDRPSALDSSREVPATPRSNVPSLRCSATLAIESTHAARQSTEDHRRVRSRRSWQFRRTKS